MMRTCAALAGGGSVTFNCGPTPAITLSAQIVITADTTIDGPNGSNLVTLSGASYVRVFVVNSNTTLTLTQLTVRDGNSGNEGTRYKKVQEESPRLL